MTCVSLLWFWYLVSLSDGHVIAPFQTSAQCWTAKLALDSIYTLDGRTR